MIVFITVHVYVCPICCISGGNPKGAFALARVQGEWKVFMKRPLDREETDLYVLNITASDGLYMSTVGVEVTIMDANDNSPVCAKVCDTLTQGFHVKATEN